MCHNNTGNSKHPRTLNEGQDSSAYELIWKSIKDPFSQRQMQRHNPSYACPELSLTVFRTDHRDTGFQGKIPKCRQQLSGIRNAYMQMCAYMKVDVCLKSFKGLVLETNKVLLYLSSLQQ